MSSQMIRNSGVLLAGRFARTLTTPSTGDVKEPTISLTKKNYTPGDLSKPSFPLSHYLDTHTAVLQLQEAGQTMARHRSPTIIVYSQAMAQSRQRCW